jgi:hypothetical protein
MTTAPEDRTPGPDDTAAFQRFYGGGQFEPRRERGVLYRLFVGWWRDKD